MGVRTRHTGIAQNDAGAAGQERPMTTSVVVIKSLLARKCVDPVSRADITVVRLAAARPQANIFLLDASGSMTHACSILATA